MQKKLPPWVSLLVIALLMIAGGLIRARLLNTRPFWDDELWHRVIVRESSYRQFFSWTYNEFHPPVSFILNRLCCDLLHSDSVWTWRLPGFVCGLLCIPAAFHLGRVIKSDLLGIGLATAVTFDLNLTWESQNARMYAMFGLLLLIFLATIIPLLRQPKAHSLRWVLAGVLLAGLLWTQLLALTVWAAFACAAAALVLLHKRWPQPGYEPRRMLAGVGITFAVACVLGAPGLYRFFAYHDGLGVPIPQHTIAELLQNVRWVTGLLIWIDFRFITPLVFALSLAGILVLFIRHREAAVLILALAFFTILAQFQILRANPYTATRYLIGLEPMVWVGLSYICLCAPPIRLRPVALGVFVAFAGFQAWNCTRLHSTYGSVMINVHESRTFVEAVSFVRANKLDQSGVTYLPFGDVAYRGEYFGLPASESLGPAPARPPSFPRTVEPERPFLHDGFDAPETWVISLVTADKSSPPSHPALQAVLSTLAEHYRVPFDAGILEKETAAVGWLVTQVDRKGIRFRAFR
jgi:hypothetical protein